MSKKYTTKSFQQTQKLGENIALRLCSGQAKESQQKGAVVLGLSGNLGGGKTTFLQGFAKGLGIKNKVLSPTFVIFKKFQISPILKNGRPSDFEYHQFFHIDCYRINKPEEILELNFKEIISNPKNIVAIEWPEKIKKYLPKNIISIKFTCPELRRRVDQSKREITINSKQLKVV